MRESRIGDAIAARWGWLVLVCIGVSYLLVFTQRTGPGVISDQLQAEFHISAAVLGSITSVQYLLYMLLQIPIGLYGDKSGPERMLVMGVLCDGVGTLVFSSAHSFDWLLVGRAIIGLGDSLIWVNIVLILAKWFAKGRFAAVLAVVNTAGNLGALVTSIPLAAWIAAAGWHLPFTVIGILLVVAGVVDFIVLIGSGPARAAAMEKAGNVRVERIPVGKMLADVIRDRLAWATFCCHFGAMGTYLSMVSMWIIPYFMDVYRLPRAEAAWFTLTAFIGALVASPVMGWLSDRLHDRRRPYLTTQTLGTIAWLAVVLWRGEPPLVVSGIIMFIVGFGCGSSLLTFAVIRDRVPNERAGVTSGFANTGGFLSAVLLPVLFGAMIDAAGGATGATPQVARHAYGIAFILPTAFSFVGVMGSVLLPKRLSSPAIRHG
ncbi:MFS transporter [Alicyclobacillus fastidiosus]|uniref:MFS transporter n=1 Tax=Alicyclobacillus fastidiosus TaxID=392011 RepID=A0ABY6ZJZ0_9BACL|nr:MFS transporter [Alicyclobacillus fastidiosus]WAH43156.1 MFS transporter [Alicyclobacillus fastidiosus]GMA65170.1 MFS transporter [Alicyclobacillus fastidiosus]